MTSDQINELRDTFRVAMLNWDVPVSITVADEEMVYVTFELWKVKYDGSFYLSDGQWTNDFDCPHYITNGESVWQWIAMQLHDKLTA